MPKPSLAEVDCLFLASNQLPSRSRRFFEAAFRAARASGLKCLMSTRYQPCKLLVVYGLGGADRFPFGMAHVASGKPMISFDLGYWSRSPSVRKYRVSLNGLHPTQVMEGPSPSEDRFHQSGLKIKSIAINPKDPILLIGNAPKSIAVGAGGWASKMSKELRKTFPKQKVLYRPKPKRPSESGVVSHGISTGPIEAALQRCSLVVCRHSNVAIDACLLGVPVVCEDGAAAVIYPNTLAEAANQPDLKTRIDFLFRLAYWQWSINEVDKFWNWFFAAFPAYDYRRIPDPRGSRSNKLRVA